MDMKNGIKYAFLDFESVADVQNAFLRIPKERYFGVNLEVRYRHEKTSLPFFDSIDLDEKPLDYKTIHLLNLPHNINKVCSSSPFKSKSNANISLKLKLYYPRLDIYKE